MSWAITAVVVSAIGTGYSMYSSERSYSAQQSAQQRARLQADKDAKAADEANNRANQKRPDTAALLSAAQQYGRAGVSGTMLTGPQGVDASALSLGKNTLLGM